jgi:hypothetical protein
MTDMRQTTARITLGEDLDGRVFIRNAVRQLVVELNKASGRLVEIAVEPGAYEVRLEREHAAFTTRALAAAGAQVALGAHQFAAAITEATRSRGSDTAVDDRLAGRTRVSMVNGLWGDSGFVNIGGHKFDYFSGLQAARYITDEWVIAVGVEGYGAEEDQDLIGGLAFPFTLQMQPRAWSFSSARPFLSGGPVIISRSEGGEIERLTAFGFQFGAGLDVQPGRNFSMTFKTAYNIVPVFGGPTWPSNNKGVQISAAVGWVFNRPR